MANDRIINGEYVEEMIVNGHKISAEVANRDDRGHLISKYYAPRATTQEKLIPGVNILTVNGGSILTEGNIDVFTKAETYSRNEVNAYLNKKIEFEYVSVLPQYNQKENKIYITSTGEIYVFATTAWRQIGIQIPQVPQAAGSYSLTCTVDSEGHKTYSWQ